jgi:hypothetical protein
VIAAMSRCGAGERRAGGLDGDRDDDRAPMRRGAPVSACSLTGSSRGARASTARSRGRCQMPWRPGRLEALSASRRIAPGAGASRAAVIVE